MGLEWTNPIPDSRNPRTKRPLNDTNNLEEEPLRANVNIVEPSNCPVMPTKIDLKDLPWDPYNRKRIIEYHSDQRDEIRRVYLIKGPCQPLGHEFPKTKI